MEPEIDDNRRYQQFLSRDRAFDGEFVAAVLTTGIYCLPSCPARRPKRENVRFFRTIEQACESGLRPCHRCRPDWFYGGAEWYESLYEQTVARVRQSPGAFQDIGAIARVAGIGRTALSELFREHGHESPGAFLRRIRIEHVCRLIENGTNPSEAAERAGFEATSAFHQQFLGRTGLTPRAYAALAQRPDFMLRLPAGYRLREVLDFHGRDPMSVSEQVSASGLKKAVLLDGKPSLIEIRFERGSACVRVDKGNGFAAHRAAVRMLGIDSDANGFERQFGDDPLIGRLVRKQRGLRIPLTPEPWEALAWAIMGQQISLRAAAGLRCELIRAYGAEHASGLRAHPAAGKVAELDAGELRRLKFSRSKAEYLIAAARAASSGEWPVACMREVSIRRAARLLGKVRGIGPWTIQYVFLRGFGFADCLPSGDAGLAQGLGRLKGERPEEVEVKEMMSRFAPYRSLATYHVWSSLKGEVGTNAG